MVDLALKPTETVDKIYTSNDRLRQQNPFMPNYIEWLWKHAEQILKVGQIASGSSIFSFYVVPKNYTLYLVSVNVCSANSSGANSGSYIGISHGGGVYSSLCEARCNTNSVDSCSTSFPMPVKVLENEEIVIVNNVCKSDGKFTGFLIANNMIPQF